MSDLANAKPVARPYHRPMPTGNKIMMAALVAAVIIILAITVGAVPK